MSTQDQNAAKKTDPKIEMTSAPSNPDSMSAGYTNENASESSLETAAIVLPRGICATPSMPFKGFNFSDKATKPPEDWTRDVSDDHKYIQVVVERGGYDHGLIICDNIPPHHLFKLAPGAQKYLYGRQIIIPNAPCIDEDVVSSVVHACVTAAKQKITTAVSVTPDPFSFISSAIKIHCILELFEMQTLANSALKKLWVLFQTVELNLEDVSWIWETFGMYMDHHNYVAPHAGEYIQMMAYQIVNMEKLGMLNKGIRDAMETEREPKSFTNVVATRSVTFGLDAGMRSPKEGKEEDCMAQDLSPLPAPSQLTSSSPNTQHDTTNDAPSAPHLALPASNPQLQPSTSGFMPDKRQKGLTQAANYVTSRAPTFVSAGLSNPLSSTAPKPSKPTFFQPDLRAVQQGFQNTPQVKNSTPRPGAGSAGWGFGGALSTPQQQTQITCAPSILTPFGSTEASGPTNQHSWQPLAINTSVFNAPAQPSPPNLVANFNAPAVHPQTSESFTSLDDAMQTSFTSFGAPSAPMTHPALGSFGDSAAQKTPDALFDSDGHCGISSKNQTFGSLFGHANNNHCNSAKKIHQRHAFDGVFSSSTALNTPSGSFNAASGGGIRSDADPFSSSFGDANGGGPGSGPGIQGRSSAGGGMVRRMVQPRTRRK